MADLIDRLRTEGREFGFFQAVRLLEEYFSAKDGDEAPLNSGRVRMSANPSLCFPPNDISSVNTDGDTVLMMLSFMGLLGISSPLPNYFSDYLARYPDNSGPLADFCAIFNHRIYALFYEAFRKYRFPDVIRSRIMAERLSALCGKPAAGKPQSYRVCAYTGTLSSRRRSASGLVSLISDYFGGVNVDVVRWVPRRVSLPNPTALNGSAALGVNTTVGTEVNDFSGKFRVAIGPLRRERFESFLEGTGNITAAREMISFYSLDPLSFDIEIKLEAQELVPVVLGKVEASLGRTSSLGECLFGAKGEAYSVVLPGRE